ncbi:hypothetical protein BVX98_03790 [bacterium F11]|nr:hypothetical protein BVX98_03790 [bacterium F11]
MFVRIRFRCVEPKLRIFGSFGTPLVFWFLMGSGLKNSFRGDLNYLQYFFPGTILLILLFTAIFSTISIIEDRNQGFLQSVLVSPTPRSALVFGKLMGGTLLAVMQGLLFIVMAPFLGLPLTLWDVVFLLVVMTLVSFALTGLGFLMAWKLDSSQGFHSIMNLFLMPLWILSGALFPLSTTPSWLSWVMIFNPLTYAMSLLQKGFFGTFDSHYFVLNSSFICFLVCLIFGVIMYILSVRMCSRSS